MWSKLASIGLAIHLIKIGSEQNAKVNGSDSVMAEKQRY